MKMTLVNLDGKKTKLKSGKKIIAFAKSIYSENNQEANIIARPENIYASVGYLSTYCTETFPVIKIKH